MSVAEEPVLTQDVFESLARHAVREEGALRLERGNGKPGARLCRTGITGGSSSG